jgi:DNA-directed RNA polymerase specialized sigma24 family protein
MDRIFPAPAIEDAFANEKEYQALRKANAMKLRETFKDIPDGAFCLMVWQHYVIEGLSQVEIAEMYGVTTRTIYNKLKAPNADKSKRG